MVSKYGTKTQSFKLTIVIKPAEIREIYPHVITRLVHNPNLLKSRSVDHWQLVVISPERCLPLGLFVAGLNQVVD